MIYGRRVPITRPNARCGRRVSGLTRLADPFADNDPDSLRPSHMKPCPCPPGVPSTPESLAVGPYEHIAIEMGLPTLAEPCRVAVHGGRNSWIRRDFLSFPILLVPATPRSSRPVGPGQATLFTIVPSTRTLRNRQSVEWSGPPPIAPPSTDTMMHVRIVCPRARIRQPRVLESSIRYPFGPEVDRILIALQATGFRSSNGVSEAGRSRRADP